MFSYCRQWVSLLWDLVLGWPSQKDPVLARCHQLNVNHFAVLSSRWGCRGQRNRWESRGRKQAAAQWSSVLALSQCPEIYSGRNQAIVLVRSTFVGCFSTLHVVRVVVIKIATVLGPTGLVSFSCVCIGWQFHPARQVFSLLFWCELVSVKKDIWWCNSPSSVSEKDLKPFLRLMFDCTKAWS